MPLTWHPPTASLFLPLGQRGVGAHLEVRYKAGSPPSGSSKTWEIRAEPERSGAAFIWSNDDLVLEVEGTRLLGEPPGVDLHWRLRARRPVRLQTVTIARFGGFFPGFDRPESFRVYRQGYQSWSPTGSVAGGDVQRYPKFASFSIMNHPVDSPHWGRRDGLLCSGVALLRPDGGHAALLGFLSARAGLGEIFVQTRGSQQILCTVDYGGRALAAGETLVGETLRVAQGEPTPLLDTWARDFATTRGVAANAAPSPVGWCSWYEFYAGVTEADILRNLAFLREHRNLGVRVVQLDDGYQAAVGDWLDWNPKFPRGPGPLVRDIHEAGFQAGLWLAPFFASSRSRLYREHRDWFLRNGRGKPVYTGFNPVWRDWTHALDLTHPEVKRWLRDTFQALVDHGFDWFKLDFLFAGLRHGQPADPSRSPTEAYRDALGIIRETVGKDRFLVGCGAPLGPSVGYFDAMRVSEDVKEEWSNPFWAWLGQGAGFPSARGVLRNNLTRASLHRTWWINDPDCVLVRNRRTRLDVHETRTLATVLGITGGMLLLSDDLPHLPAERLALAEAILPPSTGTGRPLDLMDQEFPEVAVLEGEGRRLAVRINHADTVVSRPFFPLPGERGMPSGSSVFDFWNERMLDIAEISDAVSVPRHGVLAFLVTATCPEPALVGTTLHLTALVDGRIRSEFDAARGMLVVSLGDVARRQGRLWIRVPAPWRLVDHALPPEVKETWVWREGVMLAVELGAVPCRFALSFFLAKGETPGAAAD